MGTAGAFDLGGQTPSNLPENVELHVGLIENTLPAFLSQHPPQDHPLALLHVDVDLGDTTLAALENVLPFFVPGTVICFDEMINWAAAWADGGEWAAWSQFTANHPDVRWRWVSRAADAL